MRASRRVRLRTAAGLFRVDRGQAVKCRRCNHLELPEGALAPSQHPHRRGLSFSRLRPVQCSVRGQALVRVLLDEGAGEGAENAMLDFPSVFACSRVLNFAIGAHEVLYCQ